MSASDHSSHGTLKMKKLELSQSNSIKFVADADGSKSISLHLAGPPTQAGDTLYSLPVITSAQTLLHNGSSIAASQIDLAGAAANSDPQDTDNFMIDDAGTVKKISGSALKTYIGVVDASALSGASEHEILVANGSGDMAQVAVSGDLTNSAGAFTIANDAVTNAKIANNAVNAAKIGASQVTAPKLAVGCIDNANKLGANVVQASALAANCVETAKINNNAVTKAKIQDAPSTYGTQQASKLVALDASKNSSGVNDWVCEGDVEAGASGAFRLGPESDGNWRFVVSGQNLLIQRRVAGAYVTKQTISN